MSANNTIFVLGTDTGIGKTILSLLLIQYLYRNGHNPFYIKPFQTGCKDPYDTDSDAKFVYRFVSQLKGKDPADSMIFCHRNPKAPFFSARDQDEHIDVRRVRKEVEEKSLSHSHLIIEGAGGLHVPVTDRLLMIDMVEMIGARPVIAARAGLGTINHTLLTIEALEKRDIYPLGIVLIDPGEKPTPPDMVSENIEAIEIFSGVEVAGVIGRIGDFENPGEICYQSIERIIKRLPV